MIVKSILTLEESIGNRSQKGTTVIYQLIAMATINFRKLKGVATKRGRPLNLCRVPEQQHLYGTNISDVRNRQPISKARTYSQALIHFTAPS